MIVYCNDIFCCINLLAQILLQHLASTIAMMLMLLQQIFFIVIIFFFFFFWLLSWGLD